MEIIVVRSERLSGTVRAIVLAHAATYFVTLLERTEQTVQEIARTVGIEFVTETKTLPTVLKTVQDFVVMAVVRLEKLRPIVLLIVSEFAVTVFVKQPTRR